MVPGEDELGRAGKRLIDRFDPKAVPIVCANLLSDTGSELSYPPWTVVKTKGGLRVGILGLIDQEVGRLFQEKFLAQVISDPVKGLKSHVDKLRGKCDLVVVVYHGSARAAEKLSSTKGIDLILTTHRTAREVIFPARGESTVEAPTKLVNGVLMINSETKANWSLGRVDLDLSGGKIVSAKHSLTYLDRRYEEAPEMVAIYESYNQRVKAAVLARSSKIKADMEALLTKRGLNLTEMRDRLHKSPFATAEACKTCHAQVHDNWSKSRHATAMATLEKTHQEYDPECVSCHATGVLVRNGFQNMRDTPKLANVQCESCHGPGLAHSQKPAKGYGKAGEQTCRSCHTDERTPDFEFDAAWAKVKH